MNAQQAFSLGSARAWSFAPLPAGLAERAQAWLERGPAEGELSIKPGRVWRADGFAVKRFGPEAMVRWRLRRSRARRNAQLHFQLLPIRTPRPWLVLEDPARGSLLVAEFVEGAFLAALWNGGGEGVLAFPLFLAAMHRRGVFHGDFHLLNAIWDGRDWVLLDLEGLRHPLRALNRRVQSTDHWARVHFSLRGARGLRERYGEYLSAVGPGFEVPWQRIVERSRQMARERGVDPAYADRDGQDPSPWSSC